MAFHLGTGYMFFWAGTLLALIILSELFISCPPTTPQLAVRSVEAIAFGGICVHVVVFKFKRRTSRRRSAYHGVDVKNHFHTSVAMLAFIYTVEAILWVPGATEPTSLPDLRRVHLGADGKDASLPGASCEDRQQNESQLALAIFASSILIVHHTWLSYYYYYATAALHKSSSSLVEIDRQSGRDDVEVVISPMHGGGTSGTTRQKSNSISSPVSSMMKEPMQSEEELIAMAMEAQEACVQLDRENVIKYKESHPVSEWSFEEWLSSEYPSDWDWYKAGRESSYFIDLFHDTLPPGHPTKSNAKLKSRVASIDLVDLDDIHEDVESL